MNKFIFDVDGTLTPSRGIIDPTFKEFFNKFCRSNLVYLVTGSDKAKTVEQLGEDTYNMCHTVYNCNGNDIWQSNKHIHTNEWIISEEQKEYLTDQLTASKFPLRTGLHFEHRPGMVNFSIVGRNADTEQRKMYVAWDEKYNERDLIAHYFNLMFPELQAKVGGETGIDIAPKGADKSQIIKDFSSNDFIYFFGDRMDEQGNDWPLANANKNGKNFHVKDWQNTFELLEKIK